MKSNTGSKDDGGPAFPRASGPAPRVNSATDYADGMSLRDYFASCVVQGYCANPHATYADWPGDLAREAYQVADAMLNERAKGADMTAKHAPATPLPWHKAGQNGDPRNVNSSKGARICRASVFRDAEYLAHAANAYPRLVDALKRHAVRQPEVIALLRDLGEGEAT